MSSDVIQADFEQLAKLATFFEDRADVVRSLEKELHGQMEILRGGAWIADAATAYYKDMETDALPGVHRLVEGLLRTAEVMRLIRDLMMDADEEASGFLPGGQGVEGGSGPGVIAPGAGPGTGTGPGAHVPDSGSYTDGGIYDADGNPVDSDNLDTIFVPGVGTSPESFEENMGMVANGFGGNSAGVYNQSDGIGSDVGQAIGDKIQADLPGGGAGMNRNPAVSALVEQIKRDLENGDGQVHLVAHSQGAAITAAALTQLAAEGYDLSGIEVTTFGGFGTDWPNGPTYHHFAHSGDPVPMAGFATDFDYTPSEMMNQFGNVTVIDDPAGGIANDHDFSSYMRNLDAFRADEAASQGFIGQTVEVGEMVTGWVTQTDDFLVGYATRSIGNFFFGQ